MRALMWSSIYNLNNTKVWLSKCKGNTIPCPFPSLHKRPDWYELNLVVYLHIPSTFHTEEKTFVLSLEMDKANKVTWPSLLYAVNTILNISIAWRRPLPHSGQTIKIWKSSATFDVICNTLLNSQYTLWTFTTWDNTSHGHAWKRGPQFEKKKSGGCKYTNTGWINWNSHSTQCQT